MFTKTGKKESEKMIKRKTAETTGKVEREQCLAKTGRVFCTQKLEKTGKIFNIKSRLFGNDTSILGNSRAFYTRKVHLKISAK